MGSERIGNAVSVAVNLAAWAALIAGYVWLAVPLWFASFASFALWGDPGYRDRPPY